MKLAKLSACAMAGILAVACSQQPTVRMEAHEPQRKIMSAKQWDALAERVVSNLVCDPQQPGKPVKDMFRRGKPLYIAPAAPDMVFSDTFRMYMTKNLLERGIRVSKTPVRADTLSFRVQRFLYDDRTGIQYPFDKATFWTTLGALGWAAGSEAWSRADARAALAVAGPVLDFLISINDVTNAEVVITAFVENDQTIPFMYTEEFYVEPGEVLPGGAYWTDFPVVPMGEQGPMLAGPPKSRTIRMTSH
jgi:hypothetical protein